MSPVIYISALILGFAGSFHCIGMCGPVALGISGRNGNTGARFLHTFFILPAKPLPMV
jgi:sulfite exporter TauE/SafE